MKTRDGFEVSWFGALFFVVGIVSMGVTGYLIAGFWGAIGFVLIMLYGARPAFEGGSWLWEKRK